jgi:hypothetical protein
MARKRNKNSKFQKKVFEGFQSPEVRGKKGIEIIRFIYVVFIV